VSVVTDALLLQVYGKISYELYHQLVICYVAELPPSPRSRRQLSHQSAATKLATDTNAAQVFITSSTNSAVVKGCLLC